MQIPRPRPAAGGGRQTVAVGHRLFIVVRTLHAIWCVSSLSPVTPVYFDPQQALVRQLSATGLAAKDVDAIILSHFHADHIAGLRDFPDVSCICSGEGWRQVRTLRGVTALRQAFVPWLIPENFDSSLRFIESFASVNLPAQLAPFECGYLLPESNGEIILVPLP